MSNVSFFEFVALPLNEELLTAICGSLSKINLYK